MNSEMEIFNLSESNLNVLFVPKGFATNIRQVKNKSRVVAMSDYFVAECDDDNLRWPSNFFKK